MIGYSDEESADLEAFVGLRRCVLAPTRWTAGGEPVSCAPGWLGPGIRCGCLPPPVRPAPLSQRVRPALTGA
eukprot:1122604-Prymnesium_polylepis.1